MGRYLEEDANAAAVSSCGEKSAVKIKTQQKYLRLPRMPPTSTASKQSASSTFNSSSASIYSRPCTLQRIREIAVGGYLARPTISFLNRKQCGDEYGTGKHVHVPGPTSVPMLTSKRSTRFQSNDSNAFAEPAWPAQTCKNCVYLLLRAT